MYTYVRDFRIKSDLTNCTLDWLPLKKMQCKNILDIDWDLLLGFKKKKKQNWCLKW